MQYPGQGQPYVGPAAAYNVELVLVKGQGLPKTDVVGHCDPYVMVNIGGGSVRYRSATCYCTPNPEWNEELWLQQVAPGTHILMEVHDKDMVLKDDYVGRAAYVFNPAQVAQAQPYDANQEFGSAHRHQHTALALPIVGRTPWGSAVDCGTLHIMVTGDDDQLRGFAAYKLQLAGLPYFGQQIRPQHWNVQYDKARQIFSNPVLSGALRAQHSVLYSDSGKMERRGQLRSGEDFVALLRYGVRGGERRYYTYALCTDGSLRFSETGAAFFTDMMSKHAMHAGCAETVLYAGEFCLVPARGAAPPQPYTNGQSLYGGPYPYVPPNGAAAPPPQYPGYPPQAPGQEGRYTLVLDNNSGTYAPDTALLPAVRSFLQYNLPGLEVECLNAGLSATPEERARLAQLHAMVPSRCKPAT